MYVCSPQMAPLAISVGMTGKKIGRICLYNEEGGTRQVCFRSNKIFDLPSQIAIAAMLANGSILVMGGETGSNAAPQPNLEILPRPPGSSVVHLEWLMSSDPFNLYPYIVVLPGGSVFVGV